MAYNLANEEEFESSQEKKSENTIAYVLSCMMELRDNAHIAHLQSRSYAEHIALNELYDAIPDLFDGLAESWQGKYGIISGYHAPMIQEGMNFIDYLKSKVEEVNEFRKTVKDTYIQNQLDTIVETFSGILYKLQYLK